MILDDIVELLHAKEFASAGKDVDVRILCYRLLSNKLYNKGLLSGSVFPHNVK